MALKVLLTGATGNVGGCILSALLNHSHTATAIVRQQTDGEALAARLGPSVHSTHWNYLPQLVLSYSALPATLTTSSLQRRLIVRWKLWLVEPFLQLEETELR